MALSAGLHMRQSQSLVMTPQLLQSIRLLQFSHAELAQFLEQEVERNPLLEMVSSDDEGGEAFDAGGNQDARADDGGTDDGARLTDQSDTEGGVIATELDESYENVYPDDHGEVRLDAPEFADNWKSMPGSDGARAGEAIDIDAFAARAPTLRDHVAEQIAFTFTASAERMIATELADHLDAAGYVRADLQEVADRLGVGIGRVEQVLARLQEFDPGGLFARSLSECLALQLRRKDRLDPAMAALVENLDLLARRDFQSLVRLCGVDEEDLLDMMAEIRALDPKPGTRFETGGCELVVPDVIVRAASGGGWHIELNPDTLPRVLVNQNYYASVSGRLGKAAPGQDFLGECLQSATWLSRALDQRARTIVKVATEIVRQQDAFLLHGVDQLRPLNLKSVAEAIGMHESTVSRVTSNKYMLTPRGVFELKYFFTVSIASAEVDGSSHSAEAVRHRIRGLIEQETAESVLSDDEIVNLLNRAGIDLARRTVAKYREAMSIPSSVHRRREKRARARMAGG